MEWISVKDRLPENDDTVIIFLTTHKESWVGNYDKRWMVEEVGTVYDVSHWMPMPKAPK
jgi:hypothetical protein